MSGPAEQATPGIPSDAETNREGKNNRRRKPNPHNSPAMANGVYKQWIDRQTPLTVKLRDADPLPEVRLTGAGQFELCFATAAGHGLLLVYKHAIDWIRPAGEGK